MRTGGAFTLGAPPPGRYLIVAVPDSQAADWTDPAMLEKLASIARSLDVKDGESPVVNLTVRVIR